MDLRDNKLSPPSDSDSGSGSHVSPSLSNRANKDSNVNKNVEVNVSNDQCSNGSSSDEMSQSILKDQNDIISNQSCSNDSNATKGSKSSLNNQSGTTSNVNSGISKVNGRSAGGTGASEAADVSMAEASLWGSDPSLRLKPLRTVIVLVVVPCQPLKKVLVRLLGPKRSLHLSPPGKRLLRPPKGAVHANLDYVNIPFIECQWLEGLVQSGGPHTMAPISVGYSRRSLSLGVALCFCCRVSLLVFVFWLLCCLFPGLPQILWEHYFVSSLSFPSLVTV